MVFVLVVMMFSGVQSCLAEANVGVTVGQSFDYTYALSGTERDVNGTLISSLPFSVSYLETITVQQISGTNVTIEYVRELLNGTTDIGTSWVDLSTGDGTAFFVVIPSGLNNGNLLYPDWTNENGTSEGAPIIDTATLNIGDSTVQATHFGYTYTVNNQLCYEDYYWEQSTGMLLKYTISGSEVVEGDITQALTINFYRDGLEQILYPLIDRADYPVSVTSDSNVLGFEFNQDEKKLLLSVSGKTGTVGSCTVAVPGSLLWGTFTLSLDDYAQVKGDDYTQTSNGTHQIFEINYVHSTHTIEITGAETIPEFSTVFLVSLFLVSSLAAVAVYRKRLVL